MKIALVLVDIQNDYFPNGKNPLHRPQEAAEQAGRVLAFFRNEGLTVFHVQHISKPGSKFFLPDTEGAKIHESVLPASGEEIVVKHAPSAFLRTGFADKLLSQGITHLVVCGMMSHMCIDTTVRAAQDYGFSVILLEDACTTKDLTWNGTVIPAQTVHGAIMASLKGTFAEVMTTAEYLKSIVK
jgi:nicotinamidase-related amidase